MDSQEIRDRIRLKRQQLRLSQEDAAALLECRPGTVQKLEKGPMKVTTEWLARFGKAYGVSAQYFLGESGDDVPSPGIPITYEILGNGKLVAVTKKLPPVIEPGLSGIEMIAARIAQPIYPFYHKDDIVLFDAGKQFRPKLCVNRECIIEVTRLTRLIGVFEQGSKAGHYTIMTYSGAPVKDTKITAAYRVMRIIRA